MSKFIKIKRKVDNEEIDMLINLEHIHCIIPVTIQGNSFTRIYLNFPTEFIVARSSFEEISILINSSK